MMRDSLGLRFRILFARATGLFFRGKRERDLDSELRAHLQMLTEDNTRRGLTPEEAAPTARREFGGFEATKEAYREQRRLPFIDTVVQDLRAALRMRAKKPPFARVAVLTPGGGIRAPSA